MSSLIHDHDSCSRCAGAGQLDTKDYNRKTNVWGTKTIDCDLCMKTGVELAEIGKELVTFLKDHYGLDPVTR